MTITRAPRTIFHLSTEKKWQGGEQQALHLAEGLRQRGHRSVIVARRGGAFAERLQAANFEVHTFGHRGRGPDSLWALRRLVSSMAPDVIHSHDAHAITAGGLAVFGRKPPLRVASRRVAFPIRSIRKFRLLTDVVVGISRAVMEVCRQHGIPDSMLRLVPSGVDPDRVAAGDRNRGRRSLCLQEDEPLLTVVASLTPCKGHTFLLDALPEVVAHFPKLRVAFVGDGEIAAPLKAQATRLGLESYTMFLGYRHDVPDMIQAADLFVMPSLTEGLGTSLLDAMFARVPIVTTGAGGIADVIGLDDPQGPCARVATARDSQSLASAIVEGLSRKDQGALLVERAFQRAHEKFTHNEMVTGTLAVYNEWLGKNRQRAA